MSEDHLVNFISYLRPLVSVMSFQNFWFASCRDYRRSAVYVSAALSQPTYLPATQSQKYVLSSPIGPFPTNALPPPAHHHQNSRSVQYTTHTTHPLPAHMQPVLQSASLPGFPAHAQVPPPPYGYATLSPAKSQYQHLYQIFSEWLLTEIDGYSVCACVSL